jgi:hypothetical protein
MDSRQIQSARAARARRERIQQTTTYGDGPRVYISGTASGTAGANHDHDDLLDLVNRGEVEMFLTLKRKGQSRNFRFTPDQMFYGAGPQPA